MDVISWRNKAIGHGALGYDDDPQIKKEFHALTEALTNSLRQCLADFSVLRLERRTLEIGGVQNETDVFLYLVTPQQVEGICLFPFIVLIGSNIYFLDGYSNGKGQTDLLCYSQGDKISIKKSNNVCRVGEEIALLHQKYQYEFNKRKLINELEIENSRPDEDYFLGQAEESLIEGFGIKDSVKTDYLQKWINEKLKSDKGVYLFQAYSEAGKTIASMQLEGRINNAITFHDTTVKVIYINDVNCRTGYLLDSIQRVMSCGKDGRHILRGNSKPVFRESNNAEDAKAMMAEYLNKMKRLLEKIKECNAKLILVIDGIDEVIQTDVDFFDYIPESKLLDSGIHILITSRLDEELSEEKRARLHQVVFDDNLVKRYRDEDINHMQHSYIEKQAPKLSEEQIRWIIEIGGDSFLQVHLAIFMLRNRMVSPDIFSEKHRISLTEYFLKYLVQMYSENSRNILLCVLYLLARDGKGRDLSTIAYQIGEDGVTFLLVGILYDLRPLLKVEHHVVNVFSVNHQRTGDAILQFIEQQNKIETVECGLIQCWKNRFENIIYWDEERLHQYKDEKEYVQAMDDMLEIDPQEFYFLSMFFVHPLSKKMELWNELLSPSRWPCILGKIYAWSNEYLRTKEWNSDGQLLASNMADFIERQINYQETVLGDSNPAKWAIWTICKAFSNWRYWLADLIREDKLRELLERKSEMNQCYDVLIYLYEDGLRLNGQAEQRQISQSYYNFLILIEEGILNLLRELEAFYSELGEEVGCSVYREKLSEIQRNSVKRWDSKMNDYADKEILYHLYGSARKYDIEGNQWRSDACLQQARELKEKLRQKPQDEFIELDFQKEELWLSFIRLCPKEITMEARVKPEALKVSLELTKLLECEAALLREAGDEGHRDDKLSDDMRLIADSFSNYAMKSMLKDTRNAFQMSQLANHIYDLMTIRMQGYYLLQRLNVITVFGLLSKRIGDVSQHETCVCWYLEQRDMIKGLIKMRVGKICEEAERNTWLMDSMAAPYEDRLKEEIMYEIFHKNFFEISENTSGKIFVRCKKNKYSQAREGKGNRIWVKYKKKYCNNCEYQDCPAHKGIHEVCLDRSLLDDSGHS